MDLALFRGDPVDDYPYEAPPQKLNESNFDNVENQIERVDYNFYDEFLLGNEPRLPEVEADESLKTLLHKE